MWENVAVPPVTTQPVPIAVPVVGEVGPPKSRSTDTEEVTLQAGDTVGYGSSFTASTPMRIGVVACGYADGYPRHCATGTPVLVNGVRTRTIGRVSMDMLAVDLAPVAEACLGSEVTLWGRGPQGTLLPIDEVAQSAGTIGYELMCALALRVPVRAEVG